MAMSLGIAMCSVLVECEERTYSFLVRPLLLATGHSSQEANIDKSLALTAA